MITARASKLVMAVASSALLMAACSSSGEKSSNAAAATNPPAATEPAQAATTVPATSPSVAVTTPATAGAVTTPPAETTSGGKVNINEASVPEMEKAFKAVGVTNASRWAREVEEYRPYPHDTDFAKLRQELGKYNIDPKILELIISTLEF
jgi:DNA uptake protein ComE-like DNA-binding protein